MSTPNTVHTLEAVTQFIEQEHHQFINGQIHISSNAQRSQVFNPATGQVITSVAAGSTDDANAAIQAAFAAFNDKRWSGMRVTDREKILYRFSELLIEKSELLAQIETLNQGKSIHISRAIDVGATAEYMRYMAGWTTKITGQTMEVSIPVPEGAKYTAYTQREPIGVVVGIAPWNFPLAIAVWKIMPALVAGCTVVLKPATETPLTALYLAQLAIEAGLPAGVLNVVTGSGGVVGQALIEHPLVRKITFTGSTAVGKTVGHAAVDNMTRTSLELGGKNPLFVLEDANMEQVLQGIMVGGLLNSGQVCAAASRVYVHRSRYNELAEALTAAVKNMKLGSGMDMDTQITPLVSAKQQRSVSQFINIAKSEGGQIACGGKPFEGNGFFVEPTVILNAKSTDTIVREEIFGPVLAVVPFDNAEHIIAQANESIYGLAASLWTQNLNQTMNLVPQIQAGTVWVNTHIPLDPAMPFGGVKQSGIGREFGYESVVACTELKTICIAH